MSKKPPKSGAALPASGRNPGLAGVKDGRFKCGPDPRRNRNGRRCKDLVQFEQRFKKELARGGDVKLLVQTLYDMALRQHREWAFRVLLEYAVGKPVVRAEFDAGPRFYRIIYADPELQAAAESQRTPARPLSRPLLPASDDRRPLEFIEPLPPAKPAQPASDLDDDIFETEEKTHE